jgi:hypothetical protein
MGPRRASPLGARARPAAGLNLCATRGGNPPPGLPRAEKGNAQARQPIEAVRQSQTPALSPANPLRDAPSPRAGRSQRLLIEAFREPSRPMSDSPPRRGEARRCTRSRVRRRARRKGAVSKQAQRSDSLCADKRPPASAARRARRVGLCECAMRRRNTTRNGAMTPAVFRRASNAAPGGWRLARRGSLRKVWELCLIAHAFPGLRIVG